MIILNVYSYFVNRRYPSEIIFSLRINNDLQRSSKSDNIKNIFGIEKDHQSAINTKYLGIYIMPIHNVDIEQFNLNKPFSVGKLKIMGLDAWHNRYFLQNKIKLLDSDTIQIPVLYTFNDKIVSLLPYVVYNPPNKKSKISDFTIRQIWRYIYKIYPELRFPNPYAKVVGGENGFIHFFTV